MTSHFILFQHLCNDIFISDIRELCMQKKEDVVINMIKVRREICYIKHSYNWTLLHMAATHGCSQLLKHILNLNLIPIDSKDLWGRTALDVAMENNHKDIARILEDA